jgi:hypothetical protein
VKWQVWEFRRALEFCEQPFEISDSFSLLEKQIAMRFANDPFGFAQGRLQSSSAQHSCPAPRAMFKSCRIEPEGLAAEKRMFASRNIRIPAGLTQSFAAKELLQLLLSALELGNTLGAV